VYSVQNGKAEELAALLNDAFSVERSSKKATAATLAPGVKGAEVKTTGAVTGAGSNATTTALVAQTGSDSLDLPRDVRVIADKTNNVLMILASTADYESIESAIRKIDVVPRQVLVEVTIAEITLKDELKYGLEWFFTNGSRISGQLDIGSSGVTALTPGLSYIWKNKVGDINAVLNALATDSKLKVISSPHITVADNQTAKIEVGNKVPTISQTQSLATTTTANGIISTVQYVETGVMLKVKPRINAGGLVSMEISQEVSNAIATTSSGIDSPTIQNRSAESSVTIQSGDTLILGGLISEEKSRSSEGLPLLSRIPLLGGLFGTEDRSDNRTELIVLITPKVIENGQQAKEITNEYRSRLSGLQGLLKSAGIEIGKTNTLKMDASLRLNEH
jgi:general secretion pathway protein D